MKRKDLLGYGLIISVLALVGFTSRIVDIDTKNYLDYVVDDEELSKAVTIDLDAQKECYCAGVDFDPGFYDIKSAGGSTQNNDLTEVGPGMLENDIFLNDQFLSNDECINIDGQISMIPSNPNTKQYGEQFEVEQTTDLIVKILNLELMK